jgi:hypothetical protein
MDAKTIVLETMKKESTPLNAGKIVEPTEGSSAKLNNKS